MEFESSHCVFSPDGRLIQVEYAQNASSRGAIATIQALGDKIRLAYEDNNVNSLLVFQERIHCVDSERGIYMIFSGLKPDALSIIDTVINIIRNHKLNTERDITFKQLAKKIAGIKQQFTVKPKFRPYGFRSVLFGIEKEEAQIYVIEPDGNFSRYIMCSVGQKSEKANECMEKQKDEFAFLRAISEVSQNDIQRRHIYTLTADGIIKHSKEEIQDMLQRM